MSKDLDPKYKALEDLRRKDESREAKGGAKAPPAENPRDVIKRVLLALRAPAESVYLILAAADQMAAEGTRSSTAGTVVDLCDCGQADCPHCRGSLGRSR